MQRATHARTEAEAAMKKRGGVRAVPRDQARCTSGTCRFAHAQDVLLAYLEPARNARVLRKFILRSRAPSGPHDHKLTQPRVERVLEHQSFQHIGDRGGGPGEWSSVLNT